MQLDTPLAGASQTVPQAPQFAGSRRVSTHALPHRVAPFTQVKSHAPLVQVACAPRGAGHGLAQAPQFAMDD
jgi:hypothetical protein